MANATPIPTRPSGSDAVRDGDNRRSYLLAGLVLGLVILVGVIAVAATTDVGPRRDTQGQTGEDGGAKPHIIPRPGDGVAPQNPGDRGGWEQLALFGVMATAMAGIGVVIFRGGRNARTGRQEWLAKAGATPSGRVETTDGATTPSPGDEADAAPDGAGPPETT